MDNRAEIYMKCMNGKRDYLHEDRLMVMGVLPFQEFLDFYGFDYVIAQYDDHSILYEDMPQMSSYTMIYDSPVVRVFRRD